MHTTLGKERDRGAWPAVIPTESEGVPVPDVLGLIKTLWEEGYLPPASNFFRWLPFHYHALPGFVRSRALRWLTARHRRIAEKLSFPSWPMDASADVLFQTVVAAGRIAPRPLWPDGKKFAITLTHDVDTAQGQRFSAQMAEWDRKASIPSAWFIVGLRYSVEEGFWSELRLSGHEIGLHGVLHDNLLPDLPRPAIRARLEQCQRLIERLSISGFRAPSFRVSQNLYDELRGRFKYDSSVPDTDFAGPWYPRRGCCTVFPFIRCGMLVLPPTLPPEDKCFSLGMSDDEVLQLWRDKLNCVRELGGLACPVIHAEPHWWYTDEREQLYRRFLDFLAQQEDAWLTTPGRVAELYSTWKCDV